jgi:glycosyltransferase involved in cell wall biosynthesis
MTLRVLHVVEAIEGGLARHVAQIVRHVPAEHHVALPRQRVGGFTDGEAVATMAAAGGNLHVTPMRRSPANVRNASAVARVRHLIRTVHPDAVHGHSAVGGALARLSAIGTEARRVYTPNGLLRSRRAIAIERGLGRITDAFVAVSETEGEVAARLGVAAPERISVIPNGIELDDPGPPVVDLRARLCIDHATPLVGTIARLAPQKAPEVFIRACAQIGAAMPDARFVLIGEGPLARLVEAEIAASGLDGRLLRLGGVHGAATVLPQLDVFVLASRYEGGPYAPLEAMRAGTPVVLTEVTGSRDTIEHGRSGLFAPCDDPPALAAQVIRLLGDPALRRRLAEGGRNRLVQSFDVLVMADRLAELYQTLRSTRKSMDTHELFIWSDLDKNGHMT